MVQSHHCSQYCLVQRYTWYKIVSRNIGCYAPLSLTAACTLTVQGMERCRLGQSCTCMTPWHGHWCLSQRWRTWCGGIQDTILLSYTWLTPGGPGYTVVGSTLSHTYHSLSSHRCCSCLTIPTQLYYCITVLAVLLTCQVTNIGCSGVVIVESCDRANTMVTIVILQATLHSQLFSLLFNSCSYQTLIFWVIVLTKYHDITAI